MLLKPAGAFSVFICNAPPPTKAVRATPYLVQDTGATKLPDASFEYGICDASGGWEGTALDLAKAIHYGLGMGGTQARLFSSDKAYLHLFDNLTTSSHSSQYYSAGFNWFPRNSESGTQYCFQHGGLTSGMSCFIQSRYDGTLMVLMFNAVNEKATLCSDFAQPLQDLADKVAWD